MVIRSRNVVIAFTYSIFISSFFLLLYFFLFFNVLVFLLWYWCLLLLAPSGCTHRGNCLSAKRYTKNSPTDHHSTSRELPSQVTDQRRQKLRDFFFSKGIFSVICHRSWNLGWSKWKWKVEAKRYLQKNRIKGVQKGLQPRGPHSFRDPAKGKLTGDI